MLEPQQHQIQAAPATYTTAHGNAASLTHWARPGSKPETSWFLVGFINYWATMGTKNPKTDGLKQNYFLAVPEVEAGNRGCQKDWHLLRFWMANPFHTFLLASGGHRSPWLRWPRGSSLHSLPVSSHGILPVCLCLFFLPIRTPSRIGLKPHPDDLVLTWLQLQRPCFQIRSHSQVQKVRTSTCLLGGQTQTINLKLALWPKKMEIIIILVGWGSYVYFLFDLLLDSLINMFLGVFLLGFILYGIHCASWIWMSDSFPILRKFGAIISSNIFSSPFSLLLLAPV